MGQVGQLSIQPQTFIAETIVGVIVGLVNKFVATFEDVTDGKGRRLLMLNSKVVGQQLGLFTVIQMHTGVRWQAEPGKQK